MKISLLTEKYEITQQIYQPHQTYKQTKKKEREREREGWYV